MASANHVFVRRVYQLSSEVSMGTRALFLSHSHIDTDWCLAFSQALTQQGVDVWLDVKGLFVGAQWIATIEEELQNRELFIVILTPDSWNSEWVRKEIALALGLKKHIIGIILKPTPISGFITTYQLLTVNGQTPESIATTLMQQLNIPVARQYPAKDQQAILKPTPTPSIPQVAGTWIDRIREFTLPFINPAWKLKIAQHGSTLTGETDGPWNMVHALTGTIQGNTIRLHLLIKDGYTGPDYEGVLTLNAAGTSLAGELHPTAKIKSDSDKKVFSVRFERQ